MIGAFVFEIGTFPQKTLKEFYESPNSLWGTPWFKFTLMIGISLIFILFCQSIFFSRTITRLDDKTFQYKKNVINDSQEINKSQLTVEIDVNKNINYENNETVCNSETLLNENKLNKKQPSFIIKIEAKDIDEVKIQLTYWQIVKKLITNGLYIPQVFILVLLMFVNTVIVQGTKIYLTEVIKMDKNLSNIMFIAFCLTAAPIGILFAGFFVQKKLGGYSTLNCMYYITFNTFMCCTLGISFAFTTNKYVFSVLMWFFLFFGSCTVPCIGGSIISVLPLDVKGNGSSFQLFLCNIAGYSPAPIVFGAIHEKLRNKLPTFAWSFCLSLSGLGTILMATTIYIRKTYYSNKVIEQALGGEEIKNDKILTL